MQVVQFDQALDEQSGNDRLGVGLHICIGTSDASYAKPAGSTSCRFPGFTHWFGQIIKHLAVKVNMI